MTRSGRRTRSSRAKAQACRKKRLRKRTCRDGSGKVTATMQNLPLPTGKTRTLSTVVSPPCRPAIPRVAREPRVPVRDTPPLGRAASRQDVRPKPACADPRLRGGEFQLDLLGLPLPRLRKSSRRLSLGRFGTATTLEERHCRAQRYEACRCRRSHGPKPRCIYRRGTTDSRALRTTRNTLSWVPEVGNDPETTPRPHQQRI